MIWMYRGTFSALVLAQVSEGLKLTLFARDTSLSFLSRYTLLLHENISHAMDWSTVDEPQFCKRTSSAMERLAGSVAVFRPCGDGPQSRVHCV